VAGLGREVRWIGCEGGRLEIGVWRLGIGDWGLGGWGDAGAGRSGHGLRRDAAATVEEGDRMSPRRTGTASPSHGKSGRAFFGDAAARGRIGWRGPKTWCGVSELWVLKPMDERASRGKCGQGDTGAGRSGHGLRRDAASHGRRGGQDVPQTDWDRMSQPREEWARPAVTPYLFLGRSRRLLILGAPGGSGARTARNAPAVVAALKFRVADPAWPERSGGKSVPALSRLSA